MNSLISKVKKTLLLRVYNQVSSFPFTYPVPLQAILKRLTTRMFSRISNRRNRHEMSFLRFRNLQRTQMYWSQSDIRMTFHLWEWWLSKPKTNWKIHYEQEWHECKKDRKENYLAGLSIEKSLRVHFVLKTQYFILKLLKWSSWEISMTLFLK